MLDPQIASSSNSAEPTARARTKWAGEASSSEQLPCQLRV